MRMEGTLGVQLLFSHFRWRIILTWLLVLLENTLVALIPLFIGHAIDALLGNENNALLGVASVMAALVVVVVGRRVYDTRCYGTLRVHFGAEVVERLSNRSTSQVNARLDMGREMVDFLEEHVPGLLTAVVQLIVSIAILWSLDVRIGTSSVAAIIGIGLLYALFHRRFYTLNSELNTQLEQQVAVLETRKKASLLTFLTRLRQCEVRLSDTEAILYGLIFLGMFAFLLVNLWLASTIPMVTAGAIFIILSYTWELVESAIVLPIVLQQWSRLSEIAVRLNEQAVDSHDD